MTGFRSVRSENPSSRRHDNDGWLLAESNGLLHHVETADECGAV